MTSWQKVIVMEFGKQHDTTDTMDVYLHKLVTDLCLCCGLVADLPGGSRQLVMDLLRGNWCIEFWLLLSCISFSLSATTFK